MAERIVYMNPAEADRSKAVVEALIEEGVLAEGDDIRVVLKEDDPGLRSARTGSRIRVIDVFRDGPGSTGAMDTVESIYNVQFP